MLDYAALRAMAAVITTGSFDKAAHSLNVTSSAISQRVKHLEERLGVPLIVRGTPCTATETGAWLCRHMDQIDLLEHDLFQSLPALAHLQTPLPQVTVPVATNADSLGSWFLPALAEASERSGLLFRVAVDDQDHTADWLRRGEVLAAVTSLATPVTGCRLSSLGVLRYYASASPAFIARYFPDGVTVEALAQAPVLTFNQKDRLQEQWMRQAMGQVTPYRTHWLPSTQAFVDASVMGMGWGMNPAQLAADHLVSGRLVPLIPDTPLDIPLYWQISRLAADGLAGLTQAVQRAARRALLPVPASSF